MSSNELGIAVVGGGIAGLTFAAACATVGLRCEVFEQAPYLAEVGAGIQVAPNAARVLHRLGLADQLRAAAVQPEAIVMSRWHDGRPIARTTLTGCPERFGAPYYTVHRADLHAALLERLPQGGFRLGMRCVGLSDTADGLTLDFADGHRVPADVVVGADGIHSVIRARMVRDAPRFSGQTVFRGLVSADRTELFRDGPAVRLWLGPGQHCVAYPIAKGSLISVAATAPARHHRTESWTAPGETAEVVAAYEGWDPELVALLGCLDPVRRWALHDRDTLPTWRQGCATLLGDAAHPMLPFLAQGANQAIEDAIVLAHCLVGATRADVTARLDHYQTLRLARTAEVHHRSRGNNEALHLPDGPEQRSRDEALAAAANLDAQSWLYAHDAEAPFT